VGLIGGGLAWYDEASDRFRSFTDDDGLPDNSVAAITEDLQGHLWVAGQTALTRIDLSDMLGGTAAADSGFRKYLRYFTTAHGLTDNAITGLVTDEAGFIWAASNKGLNQFDPISGTVVRTYGKRHGLLDNEIGGHNAMLVDRDRRIWIGTSSGMTRMPADMRLKDPPIPSVYLKRLASEDKNERTMRLVPVRSNPAVQNDEVRPIGSATLKAVHEILYQENNLHLEFISPSFVDESDVLYSYRLLGFENEWSRPGHDNRVRYTNLDAGHYVFQVRACNGFGLWSSEPLTIAFTIQTPFWATWWFILFVITFIGLSGYTAFQFRISLVQGRTQELEERVLHRTKELVKQKETLERVLAELKETQLHLIHSEKMASLGQLVAGIAHEINNPITYVKANLAILERLATTIDEMFHRFSDVFEFHASFSPYDDPLHRSFRKKLEQIDAFIAASRFQYFLDELPTVMKEMRDGVERTQKIVEDLRNFSRLDEAQYKEISITDSIESTLNILKNEYKSRVRIHRNFGTLPPIYCNPGHINQVIMNLLTNAFHAIDGDGDVWIRTSAGTNNILITIRDNGRGIPFEIQHRVFDPFFTTKPVGKGTGLGLSISYKIIEAHKGTIFFESEPGRGTEFKITLPIRRTGL
jgi:signal transduction histidine kinase